MKPNTRSLYQSTIADFIQRDASTILGHLVNAYHGCIQTTQSEAWKTEIELLQSVLLPWKFEDAHILFEYDIPRLGKRVDVVLLLCGMVFCLEFMVGQAEALQSDVEHRATAFTFSIEKAYPTWQ